MTAAPNPERWRGLRAGAREALEQRDYSRPPLGASEVIGKETIPGVMVFPRKIFSQPHRGFLGELGRRDSSPLVELQLWPAQWASACMFGGTAKGFHIHPPHVPADAEPEGWFRRLYVDERDNVALRPYDKEQWDVMFFVRGLVELILVDEREGLPREVMQFFVDGDNHAGADNAGVVIPAGVAHALRAASSEDVMMIYGTSTTFDPLDEGRIGSAIEKAPLPEDWQRYLRGGTDDE